MTNEEIEEENKKLGIKKEEEKVIKKIKFKF